MESPGVWEQIYLRCLEIDKAADESEAKLEALLEHLSTINESLPSDIDPAESFEFFVIAKLCLSTSNILDKHLTALTSSNA